MLSNTVRRPRRQYIVRCRTLDMRTRADKRLERWRLYRRIKARKDLISPVEYDIDQFSTNLQQISAEAGYQRETDVLVRNKRLLSTSVGPDGANVLSFPVSSPQRDQGGLSVSMQGTCAILQSPLSPQWKSRNIPTSSYFSSLLGSPEQPTPQMQLITCSPPVQHELSGKDVESSFHSEEPGNQRFLSTSVGPACANVLSFDPISSSQRDQGGFSESVQGTCLTLPSSLNAQWKSRNIPTSSYFSSLSGSPELPTPQMQLNITCSSPFQHEHSRRDVESSHYSEEPGSQRFLSTSARPAGANVLSFDPVSSTHRYQGGHSDSVQGTCLTMQSAALSPLQNSQFVSEIRGDNMLTITDNEMWNIPSSCYSSLPGSPEQPTPQMQLNITCSPPVQYEYSGKDVESSIHSQEPGNQRLLSTSVGPAGANVLSFPVSTPQWDQGRLSESAQGTCLIMQSSPSPQRKSQFVPQRCDNKLTTDNGMRTEPSFRYSSLLGSSEQQNSQMQLNITCSPPDPYELTGQDLNTSLHSQEPGTTPHEFPCAPVSYSPSVQSQNDDLCAILGELILENSPSVSMNFGSPNEADNFWNPSSPIFIEKNWLASVSGGQHPSLLEPISPYMRQSRTGVRWSIRVIVLVLCAWKYSVSHPVSSRSRQPKLVPTTRVILDGVGHAGDRYPGIRKRKGLWVSEIRLSKKKFPKGGKLWLGTFNDIEKAKRAYDAGTHYCKLRRKEYYFSESPSTLPSLPRGNLSLKELKRKIKDSVKKYAETGRS